MSKYDYQCAGGILGSGTYGIIINPSLTCSLPDYSNKKHYVSKLIENNDLQSEYTNIISSSELNIRELDPESKHLVYPIQRCSDILDFELSDMYKIKRFLSSNSREKPRSFGKLKTQQNVLDVLNEDYSNIIMAKAEFDLHEKPNLNKVPLSHFLNGIINIIIGTRKISTHNVTHRDIKPLNIVYSNNTFKIIDFGLAAKKMYMNFSDDGMNHSIYQYWSLDYKIFEQFLLCTKQKKHTMNIPMEITSESVAKILKSCATMNDKIIGEMNKFGVPINKIYNKPKNIVELTNLVMKLIRIYKKDPKISQYSTLDQEYKRCVHYIDTYSLAMSIFEIINKYTLMKEHRDDLNIILTKYISSSYLVRGKLEDLLLELSRFFSSKYTRDIFDITQFQDDISANFSDEIYSRIME